MDADTTLIINYEKDIIDIGGFYTYYCSFTDTQRTSDILSRLFIFYGDK